ncbi:MAG: crossover junction endodeoxyribonuclease RuvC [bacterium]|nr:crossover junction endodeoxyribonuclease RuvC [bacterium]
MIILGIDPGIARMGFGIIEEIKLKARAIEYGCVETSKDIPHAQRLLILHKALTKLIQQYHPERVAVEQLFFSKNVKTALQVGEARGVIMLTCQMEQVPVVEISPKEVKVALTGYGQADKPQMQKMIQLILKLKTIPKPDDAADALAIAIAGARM